MATRCFRSSLIIVMALVVSLSLNKGAIMGWAQCVYHHSGNSLIPKILVQTVRLSV
jgi:hypothetical protein